MKRIVCALAALLSLSVATADNGRPAPLRLADGFATPLQVDAALLASLTRTHVEASDHGKPARWDGVALTELLSKAGAPAGKQLRGAGLSLCLRFSAADGYRTVLALAEFDPEFGNAGALLADTRDGKPLDANEGPYRLILPREQRAGRWIRQLERVDLLDCGDAPAAKPAAADAAGHDHPAKATTDAGH